MEDDPCEFTVTPLFVSWLFDASGPGDGFIEVYDWDFGDGTSVQTGFPTLFHSYAGPGIYTVTLTTTLFGGATVSTCTQTVVVP